MGALTRRTVRYLLGAAVLAGAGLGGWSLGRAQERAAAALALEAQYQRAFYSYVQHVQDTEALLAKAMASSSPGQQALLLAQVRSEAQAAAEALAQLPVGVDLQETHRLLAQTGDVAYTLAQDLAAGRAPEPREWQLLNRVHTAVARASQRLTELQVRALREGWRWTQMERRLAGSGSAGSSAPSADSPAATAARGTVADGLQQLDRELQQVAVPAYDGPLSDHNLARTPREPLGPEITAQEAEAMARRYAGGPLQRVSREELSGPLPGWVFTFRRADGARARPPAGAETVAVAVSRQGGRLLWMLSDAAPGPERFTLKQALTRARQEARRLGFGSTETAGWIREGGALTVTLVPVTPLEEVVATAPPAWARRMPVRLYPDAVKVTVGPDGRLQAVDARSFWLNRHRRQLPPPLLREDQARAAASPALQVQGARLAVILLPSGREALVWELTARLGRDTFLAYLNARSGREEALLRLLTTPAARLTQ